MGVELEVRTDLDLGILRNLFLAYNPKSDFGIVEKAYCYSAMAHAGQTRVSGEPYILHPVEVATILAEHRFDAITLASALLHDVIEDCGRSREEIEKHFGAEIAGIVEGVTKISTISEQTRQETVAENLRRMLVAVARDIRVLLIKLADRLHNMRTLGALDRERIERISRETLEIYAPLANRMGMSAIRAELENLGFRHLMPEKHAEITAAVQRIVGQREKALGEAAAVLTEKIRDAGIAVQVTSRSKEPYSVYKKMLRQNRPIEEIFDLLAMRVLVPSLRECYASLGIVHTLWKPIPGRFKDYVAMPKPNMYQALHTSVIGPGEGPLEIQIRTHEMHLTAEEGIAAHWKYKSDGNVDERLGWLRRILEWQREAVSAQEFMDSLRIDLYSDQVFVLTPKGDIIELPAGATPIDMAYAVHSEVGNHISGARVNGRMVPITSRLISGSVVEIMTSAAARPSRDWLDVVRTPRARSKIRHHLKERDAVEYRRRGADLLEAALRRFRLGLSVAQESPELVEALEGTGFKDLGTMLEAIGFGSESAEAFAKRIADRRPGEEEGEAEPEDETAEKAGRADGAGGHVLVEGVRDMVVRFGRCCNPVPGDDIVGYLSRGRGVSIHRKGCPNVASLAGESARMVKARWAGEKGRYSAGLMVEGEDRIGFLADVTGVFAREGANIVSAEVRTKGVGRDSFVVEVTDAAHLARLIAALKAVPGMKRVTRSAPR